MTGAMVDPGSGWTEALDPADSVVYDLRATGPLNGAPFALIRVDLDSQGFTVGPALSTLSSLIVTDGYLWAGWPTSSNGQASPTIICQFDLTSMALVRVVSIPTEQNGQGLALARGPEGTLLVGDGTCLFTVAASDGALRTITTELDGPAASVTTAPQGDIAYVAAYPPDEVQWKGSTQVVDEVDLSIGAVVARTGGEALSGVGPGTVTAVVGGVLLSWRTGMYGDTVLLRQSDLSAAPTLTDPNPLGTFRENLFDSIMGQSTVYADGAAWISAGDGQLGCLDPSNGTVRAETAFPSPEMAIVGVSEDGQVVVYYWPLGEWCESDGFRSHPATDVVHRCSSGAGMDLPRSRAGNGMGSRPLERAPA